MVRLDNSARGNGDGVDSLNGLSGDVVLAAGPNITLTPTGNTISISAGGGTGGGNVALSGSNGSFTFQTATFGNLNGMSFYTSNGSMVGSYTVPAATVFSNSNNVSFGLNGSTLTATATFNQTAQTQSLIQALYDGANSITTGTVRFTNANGVTFSINGQTLSASVNTSYRASNDAIGLNTAQSNVTWTVNSSGISLDGRGYAGTGTTFNGTNISGSITQNSNGIRIDASVANPGGGGITPALSGSNGSFSFSTATFGNLNGMSFYTSNGSMVGSYTVPTVTSWTVSDSATSATVGRLAFSNANGITFGLSTSNNGNHSISASHNGLTSQSNQNALAANGNFNFQTISFSNANGVSFVTSAGSAIAASVVTSYRASNDAVGLNTAQSNVTWTVNSSGISLDARGYAGTGTTFTGTNVSGSITLNSNGLNLALSAASAAPSPVNFSAGTTSNNLASVIFADANNVSFGLGTGVSSQSITATASFNQTNQTLGKYVVGNTTGQSSSSTFDARTMSFVGQGIVSVGFSNGSMNISATQSNQALSASNGSFTYQTAGFSNANGVTFGTSAGSIMTASVNTSYRASNDAIGLNTAQSNVTWTVNSSGVSLDARGYAGTGTSATNASITLNSNGLAISVAAPGGGGAVNFSAGTTSNNLQSVIFANANSISFGLGTGASSQSITASYAPPTASRYALGNTTGQSSSSTLLSSYAGMGAISVGFSSNSGVLISGPATSSLSGTGLVSLSTNGSTISIGVQGTTYGGFDPTIGNSFINRTIPAGSIGIYPIQAPNFSCSRVDIPVYYNNTTGTTGTQTISAWIGIYTRNSNSLSILSSVSTAQVVTGNGTVNSSINAGIRNLTIGLTGTFTANNYWLGWVFSTNSAGGNATINMMASTFNNTAINFSGVFGVASNVSNQFVLGSGWYSSTAYTMPNAIPFSDIRGQSLPNISAQKIIFNATNLN